MIPTQEVDSVWRAVKPCGKYQFFQMFLTLVDFIPACFAILSAVFTGYLPDHMCDVSEDPYSSTNGNNITYDIHDQKCSYDVIEMFGNTSTVVAERECTKFTYHYDKSYAYEWGLICSRANLAALAQSMALAGQAIGALVMSHIADRFGRKRVHVIAHIGVMMTMVLMAFSVNIYMLLTLRLVAGTFQQGIICTGKVLGLEMFPKEMRSHTEAISFIAWSVGIMVLTLYGYLFRDLDWRYLQIGLAAFSFYALFEWWIMDESLRWLVSNGRIKEAKQVLKKAATWNGTDVKIAELALEENVHLTDHPVVNNESSSSDTSMEMNDISGGIEKTPAVEEQTVVSDKDVEKYTVIDILKNPNLRINTFILWYSWIVAAGTYYGMTLVSSHLAGDRFVNFFLSGCIEIPALLLEFYLFNKYEEERQPLYQWKQHKKVSVAGEELYVGEQAECYYKDYPTCKHDKNIDATMKVGYNACISVSQICMTYCRIGRKKTMILFFATAGFSLIVSTALLYTYADSDAVNVIAKILSLIGKSASTGCFSAVFLYTPEIYPTNYRNSGLGIASSISRIGGILAPFASNLALIALWIPGAIFGSMCMLVVILALRLPESAKHELPATIAECNTWEGPTHHSKHPDVQKT